MSNLNQTSLIVRKETIYDKIRTSLLKFIYQKDYQMVQRLEEFIKPKKPNKKIIIPQEIGRNIKK